MWKSPSFLQLREQDSQVNRSEKKGLLISDQSPQFLAQCLVQYANLLGEDLELESLHIEQLEIELLLLERDRISKDLDYLFLFPSTANLIKGDCKGSLDAFLNEVVRYFNPKESFVFPFNGKSLEISEQKKAKSANEIFANNNSWQLLSFIEEEAPSMDLRLLESAGMEYAPDAFSLWGFSFYLRKRLSRIKVLVLDLDNTLWGGVLGELGKENLVLDSHYISFQETILELKRKGLLLVIASKNNESFALEAISVNSEMRLRKKDFVAYRIGWEGKEKGIFEMANELNLGLNSFLFLDDQLVERERVRTFLPEVLVPEFPTEPSKYASFLESLDLGEEFLESKIDRTQLYQEEHLRKKSALGISEKDFLLGLQMEAKIEALNPDNLLRAQELLKRTNQFNLNKTMVQIDDLDFKEEAFLIELSDKFGSYGQVVFVLLDFSSDGICLVKSWLMSCRVFSRGLEHFTLNEILRRAQEKKVFVINADFKQREKNQPVLKALHSFGFKLEEDSYSIPLGELSLSTNYING